MKKVGIITMYYNSLNYGGLLQAFALQKKIEKLGANSKQITFNKTNFSSLKQRFFSKKNEMGVFFALKWAIEKIIEKIISKISKKFISKNDKSDLSLKFVRMSEFRESIPHTEIYDESNINKVNSQFDVFICGSDQIWKPGVLCNEYILKFVDKNKVKASYAASISNSKITKDEINEIVSSISDYNAVSIREMQDSELLNKYGCNSKWVLDPTLLLNSSEWDEVVSERLVEDKYIFVYLLGKNRKCKKILKNYAQKYNLKIVNLKYASGDIKKIDSSFGDYNFININPNEFISLIKNAEIVVTDSFHATVFSIIYNRTFYTIQREEEETMENRIKSLLNIVDEEKRFIKIDELLEKNQVNKSKYLDSVKFKKMKSESENFLKDLLK